MRDPFFGIRLKLERTQVQNAELRNQISSFLETKPYGTTIKLKDETREIVVRATVREPCPGVWGVLVGEFIHNLRSVLDHLVWEFVIYNTGAKPTTNTQFPICLTETAYNKAARRYLNGVGATASDLIKSVQPFSTGEDSKSHLWKLASLSNADKHRTLHLTSASMQSVMVHFEPSQCPIIPPSSVPTLRMEARELRGAGPFEHDTILVRIGIPAWFVVPTNEVKVDTDFRTNIAFDEGTPVVGGAVVIPTINEIGIAVMKITNRSVREVFGAGPIFHPKDADTSF